MAEDPDVRAIQVAESRVSLGNHVLLVERRDDGGVLRLLAPDGSLPIEIAVSNGGAVLRLGRGLAVSIDGPLELEADSLSLRARRGNVDIAANDDVTLRGERLKLNC